MRVSILQPTYWARAHVWNRILGSDAFVWLDHVKFSRSATKWEDRTIVEEPDGRPVVLRLPLRGSRMVAWSEAGLNDGWQRHAKTIRHCYAGYPAWARLEPVVEAVYGGSPPKTIAAVCWRTFESVRDLLGCPASVVRSSELDVEAQKGYLVLELVQRLGGTTYVCGEPGASYLPREAFADAGVTIEVQHWSAPTTQGGLLNPSILHLLAENGARRTADLLSTP